jgi:hypothetical protein
VAIETVRQFETTFSTQKGADLDRDWSQLISNGSVLPFKIPNGKIFRQFKVGQYFLVITLYDAWDYESFSLILLDEKLGLLETHISPNCFDADAPYDSQFVLSSNDTLSFHLAPKSGKNWEIQVLEKPRYLGSEAMNRVRFGWWFNYELPRLFRPSRVSIRPKHPDHSAGN